MSKPRDKEYLHDYVPKSNGQAEFLSKYPNYDGRGTRIAILDGCIDVSLPGLQQNSIGLPKIIDCNDLTGNGTVDTSIVRYSNLDNILIGLTGRRLKIPSSWSNPSNQWHLGIKSIYEFFVNTDSMSYITKARKEQIIKNNEKLKKDLPKMMNTEEQKMMLQYLNSVEENLHKDSLVTDCLVWFDGEKWVACLDTSFCGNLEMAKVMTNFQDQHEFDFLFENNFSFCFSIQNSGNLLEIYVASGDHGTTVAHIAASHFPNDEKMDGGLAPGAQILSYSIMDPRNEGRMNCRIFKTALQKCIEMKADIVNLSLSGFPEDAYPLMKEMVEKHRILIFKSNGNGGPVHFSIDSLNTKFQDLILNVASVTMASDETTNSKHISPPFVSSYSSRGPFFNGTNLQVIAAPGEAITSVPRFFPYKYEKFSGTSFSCPNAAGAIACLISALKANSISISVFKLKLAIFNTATTPQGGENSLAYGNGIIQIFDAFEFYQNNLKNFPEGITNISVQCCGLVKKNVLRSAFGTKDNNNCIVIREKGKFEYNLKITVNSSTVPLKKNILWKLGLPSDDGKNIVTILPTETVDTFLVVVNTCNLNLNQIYHFEIHGFDNANFQWGPLFRFPITVILPKKIENNALIVDEVIVNPGIPWRLFISPPTECEHVVLKLASLQKQPSTIRVQYSTQNGGDKNYNSNTFKFESKNQIETWCFCVQCYDIQEICLTQDHEEEGLPKTLKFKMELHFFGFTVNSFKIPGISYLPINFMSIHNFLQPLKTTFSINFEEVTFPLWANNIFMEPADIKCPERKRYFKVVFNFQVKKQANCRFSPIYLLPLTFYVTHRFQIYTLSRKFIYGFINSTNKGIILPPGDYIIIGHFENQEKTFLQRIRSLILFLPYIFVTMEFEKVWTPTMYSKITKTQKYKITEDDEIVFDKNQRRQLFYNEIPKSILPSSQWYISHLNGYLKFNFEDTVYEYPIKQIYYGSFTESLTEFWGYVKEFFQSNFLPYSLNVHNILNNISNKSANKCQTEIIHFYSKQNFSKLIEAVDFFLENVKAESFFTNYQNIFSSVSISEQKLLYQRKILIQNVLFLKADLILDKFIKDNNNIPMKIKEKLKLLSRIFRPEINHKSLSLFEYPKNFIASFFPAKNDSGSSMPESKNPELSADSIYASITSKAPISVTKVCQDFLNVVEESDVRKDVILIKKAIAFCNYGTSLFHLNKILIENSTLPAFKVVDELIIEILKHFQWNHLIEIHENFLLDKYRNYYRPF